MKMKELCKKYNLRYCLRFNEPIAPTRSRKFPLDHIYDGFENGWWGVSITRPSNQKLNNVIAKLENFGAALGQRGDMEANLRVNEENIVKVASLLKIKKTASIGSLANLIK